MIKYSFDRVFALLALILTIPFFIFIPVIIKTRSKGPVFFRQERVGKNGSLFTVYKFRTMVTNIGQNSVTARSDPRITREGAWLRKWKLDELPELFNVLIGDMSFVGPRPDVPGYADALTGDDRLLLTVRPGLTGAASIKYSNEEELLSEQEDPIKFNDEVLYPEKVRINNNYVKKYH